MTPEQAIKTTRQLQDWIRSCGSEEDGRYEAPSAADAVAALDVLVAAEARVKELEASLNTVCESFQAARVDGEMLMAGNERLRAALERISRIEDQKWGRDWQEIELAREIARAALAEPKEER